MPNTCKHRRKAAPRIEWSWILGLVGLVSACSAPPTVGLRGAAPTTAAVAPADFRLTTATVRWLDEPNVRTTFSYGTDKYSPKPPTEAQRKAAQEDFAAIQQIMRAGASPQLGAALARAGVPPGDDHLILLTPTRLYRDVSGWGSGIDVRVSVQSAQGRERWSASINVDSGLQWLGPSVSKPGEWYAKELADSVVKTFRQAGLLAQ